jgi:hypothetical protein
LFVKIEVVAHLASSPAPTVPPATSAGIGTAETVLCESVLKDTLGPIAHGSGTYEAVQSFGIVASDWRDTAPAVRWLGAEALAYKRNIKSQGANEATLDMDNAVDNECPLLVPNGFALSTGSSPQAATRLAQASLQF